MKNFILIVDNKSHTFDTLDELKKEMFLDFNNITEDEQKKYFYKKIFGFSILNNLQIVDTKKGVYESNYNINKTEQINIKNAIIIDNIDTYILSLCKFNAITLLEEKNNRFYTKNIDINFNNDDNYVIVNSYANDILYKLVGDLK